MDKPVVLLNADYTPLGVVSWKKAIKLIVKKRVEIVKVSKVILHNFEKTIEMAVPLIIRLIKFIRALWRTKVPYNKRNVMVRDNWTCAYCGLHSHTGMSVDHVIPKSKGGKSTFDNVVTSCVSCNNKKDNNMPNVAKMFPKIKPFVPTINQFFTQQIKNAGLDSMLKEVGL
jgi:5-methylcytosine-specific restriction endonuclease McrA